VSATGVDVVVDRVGKTFDGGRVRALEDASLRLEGGEFVALTGPSGSGKSTLLNLIGALERPDNGTIAVAGRDLATVDDLADYRAATVGFVFQLHHLIPTLSARENVEVPMIGRGLGRSARIGRASKLLAEVGLAHRGDAAPATLSGGERQRVAIARALANEPRLLLADEPTGALDSETGARVMQLLLRLRDQRGMTVLLVTNDEDLGQQADRMLRLRDGKVDAPGRSGPRFRVTKL
jgi:putative ABC transport system ATP-binding protein